jgi:hypothetical protein
MVGAGLDVCREAAPLCAALVRAWRALSSVQSLVAGAPLVGETAFIRSLTDGDPPSDPAILRNVPPAFVATVVACARAEPFAETPPLDLRELERHYRRLLRSSADTRRQVLDRFGGSRPCQQGRAFRRVALACGGLVLVAAAASIFLYRKHFRPRWLASYYGNETLTGAPMRIVTEHDPNHDWGFGGPGIGLPTDSFSARFETCLVMTKPANVVFSVGSDDGSRLFVDDSKLIDSWVEQTYMTHERATSLTAGVHRIRLEFFDHAWNAQVTFGGRIRETLADIDGMLRLPGPSGCGH